MDSFGGKMKVATQSCSLFKLAQLAKVAGLANALIHQENGCKFKVAGLKLQRTPPLYKGGCCKFPIEMKS